MQKKRISVNNKKVMDVQNTDRRNFPVNNKNEEILEYFDHLK